MPPKEVTTMDPRKNHNVERTAFSVDEAAESMGTSRQTVWELIRSSRNFPHVRITATRVVIPVAQLRDWLAREAERGATN
jgi:excisionase family DNA binding protein